MARRRRPGSRTSVVDGRAQLIIPVEAFNTADDEAMRFAGMKKWMPRVASFPADLGEASGSASILLDGFAYDIHLSDVAHASDTHDGPTFLEAARTHSAVDVYVADEIDPRRSSADELTAAGEAGKLVAGRVAVFVVDQLSE